MNKILMALAATALAWGGVTGCQNDLHDVPVGAAVDLKGYHVVGSMVGWDNKKALKFSDGADVYHNSVTFAADADEVLFAFIPNAGSWDGQIGGDKIKAAALPDGAKYEAKDNGNGGLNGVISGLKKGSTYKMSIDSTRDIVISVESAEPPKYFLLEGVFVAGDAIPDSVSDDKPSNAKYLLRNPAKNLETGDVVYTVEFTANDKDTFFLMDLDGKRYGNVKVKVGGDAVSLTKDVAKDKPMNAEGIENGKAYKITVTTKVDETVSLAIEAAPPYYIAGFKVINVKDYTGDIFFLEGWVPGNAWGKDTPNKATVTDGVAELKFKTPYEQKVAETQIQIIVLKDAGDFWNGKGNKFGGGTIKFTHALDTKKYMVVFDYAKPNDKPTFEEVQ